MTRDEMVARVRRWRSDIALFAQENLTILDKDGRMVPFFLNDAQKLLNAACDKMLAEVGYVRFNLDKGRQMGMSTAVAARFIRDAVLRPGIRVMVVCHKQEATRALAQMTRRFYDWIPGGRKPALLKKNDLELVMDSGSSYLLTTAGSRETGRGSTIQRLHASEFAYWNSPEEHMAGLGNALAEVPGSEAIRESTANGQANVLYDEWRKAEAGVGTYRNLFLPWFLDRGYSREPPSGYTLSREPRKEGFLSDFEYREAHDLSLGQMYWRDLQIQDKGFVRTTREYPATAAESFITTGESAFVNAHHVAEARRQHVDFTTLHGTELVVGVDPATSHGPDSSALIRRRRHKAYGLERWPTITPDQLAARVWSIWTEEKPAAIVVDQTEGVGDHIFNVLYSRGAPVTGVFFGGSPDLPERYFDKRAELYSRIAGWLPGADIPDDEDLARDLLAQKQMSEEQVRIRLVSKPRLRAEGHPSPDAGDALALTMEHIDPEPAAERLGTVVADNLHRDADLRGLIG